MIFLDYYRILGIDKTATPKEVKDAYRKLARKFHPDLHPDDRDAKKNFQQINEANEVLSDPVKREKYDQYGKDWQHAAEFEKGKKYQEQSSGYQRPDNFGGHFEGEYSDFFENIFGRSTGTGKSRQVKFRGEDYHAELNLDLLNVYKTHKQTLTVNAKKIRITIPAGIENGQTIKISGHGGPGINGGPNGDLYITFLISNHPKMKRLGNDLYKTADLDLYTAVLGGEITLDTLNSKVKLKVKPGTQNGSKVKLTGKGFPLYKNEGHYGDLFVTYFIQIPTNLTDKQRRLFEELSRS